MNKIKIDLENCYGIKKLYYEFDFSKNNGAIIYGANGVFKTSFSETFIDIMNSTAPKDRVHKTAITKATVTVDSVIINPNQILVVKSYEEKFGDKRDISSLMVSSELRKKYDELTKEIEEKKREFLDKLIEILDSKKIETELKLFLNEKIELSQVIRIKELDTSIDFDLDGILYQDIFNSKTLELLKKKEFISLISEYIENYNLLLRESSLYKKGIFNQSNISDITLALEKNKFFHAEHKIILNSISEEISDIGILKNIIEEEKNKIFNNKILNENFSKIEKLLTKNQETKKFREILENKKELIVELGNAEEFKSKVWKYYFLKVEDEINNWNNKFKENKDKILDIIEKAKAEKSDWDTVIELYKNRFIVPFDLKIKNRENSILKIEEPQIEFKHSDIIVEENELKHILSQGEKRALYILEILYEIEKKKRTGGETLLILDDIADSFDYKNKYAIIEYLNDLIKIETFNIIILTHNFDFYRTVSGRLNLENNKYMAIKDENEVRILNGGYTKNIFSYWKNLLVKPSKSKNINKIFLAAIPFVRNLIEYSKEDTDFNYTFLTEALHMKSKTKIITVEEIYSVFHLHWGIPPVTDKKKYIDLLYSECDTLKSVVDSGKIELENKIILSIGIRLKAETYMISKLPSIILEEIKSNQTFELLEKYKKKYPASNNIKLLEQVQMMTPENIHLNSFMYEPLLDISDTHLKKLYSDLSSLLSKTSPKRIV